MSVHALTLLSWSLTHYNLANQKKAHASKFLALLVAVKIDCKSYEFNLFSFVCMVNHNAYFFYTSMSTESKNY